MKKAICTVLVFAVGLALASCGLAIGPGVQDWSYDLPNGYRIMRVNSREILIGWHAPGDSVVAVEETVDGEIKTCGVGAYVSEFCAGDRFVGVRQVDVPSTGEKIDLARPRYFLIDTPHRTVFGPYDTEEGFADACREQGAFGETGDWIKTVPAPEGAEY